MTSAHGSWLHICPASQPPTDNESDAQTTFMDGVQQRFFVSSKSVHPGCRSVALSAPADAIAAVRLLPPETAAGIRDTLVLHGIEQHGRFLIADVDNGAPAQAVIRAAAPFGSNMLPAMALRIFGAEERVKATLSNGRLTLQCLAGKQPAGVVLSAPWYLPLADVQVQVDASGNGIFELLIADTTLAALDTPRRIGTVTAAIPATMTALTLPTMKFDRKAWQFFTLACPPHAAQLTIEALRLQPRNRAAGDRASRSSWTWDARAWQQTPEQVIAHAAKYGVKLLFISVPVIAGSVVEPHRLASFIAQASARGIAVWSVDGDPHMTLRHEHAATARRVRAYVAFNAAHAATKIAGMQFDVEPYLLPGYANASRHWENSYLQLARALHRAAAGLPLEFVVPFWWADKDALLHRLAPFTSGLTIMDYRTDAEEIYRFAAPFLDWGVAHRKHVRVALEAGPVAAETQRTYLKATNGELWLVQTERDSLLLLLKEARSNPVGPAFKLTGSKHFDGTATSFMGDSARLLKALPELEVKFSAWNSFAGMALHEVK